MQKSKYFEEKKERRTTFRNDLK